MILVGTLIGWNVLIDWLTFRSDRLRRLLSPRALHLVSEAACCGTTCAGRC